ncbi:MAG: hypothetical protein ACJ8HU_06130 [Chthoniobacterales bacterium]
MKTRPIEIHQLSNELTVCQVYDPQVKADLFMTALGTSGGSFLVDPFAVDAATLDVLTHGRSVAGLIVTNENHHRASLELAERLAVTVFADADATVPGSRALDALPDDLRVIAIPGAAKGEIALHCARDGGTVVIGDAVINSGSYGFTPLPPKYCENPKLLQKSLRSLLDLKFERIFFAHGTPIVTNARARLAALLENET